MKVEEAKQFKKQFEKMELEDILELQLILQGIVILKVKEIKIEVDEILDDLGSM